MRSPVGHLHLKAVLMSQLRPFEVELGKLEQSLMAMGNLVRDALSIAIDAILSPTPDARERIRAVEVSLDQSETDLENHSHLILALQGLFARDLRLLVGAMRVTTSLEHVGDLAESVAKRASYIARHHAIDQPSSLPALATLARQIVDRAIRSFAERSADLAKQVLLDEKESDRLTKACYAEVRDLMTADASHVDEYIHLIRSIAMLEHIADLAAAIADETIFVVHGDLVQHQHNEVTGTEPAGG